MIMKVNFYQHMEEVIDGKDGSLPLHIPQLLERVNRR